MSWQLASFLILGAVLLGGFAWYERSRPPSQVVALVAALAALAIAGRVAFAALPNVKPTTDIVVFAGYALGPAPGFAVGALAGLVSNFWFGQGPWTPWQMAGWGLCGILGAALALGVRNAGRLSLAAACGFAALAYGALLNFSLMATYGGELSWRLFLTYEARAIPFEAAHLIGNVTLALIAGPAMVRMLRRFRERFEWRGRRAEGTAPAGAALRGGAVAALLLVALVAIPAPRALASQASRAVNWLESTQNPDGGWGASPGKGSSPEITAWAMLGLEAAGRNPLDVAGHGHDPLDLLRADAKQIRSAGDLARTILALEGAGADPRSFAGRNLVAELAKRRRADGSFEGWPATTAFSVIALRAAGASGGLEGSLAWLHEAQNADGGWGDEPGAPSTADDTGAVLQALSGGSKASGRGLAWLRKAQRPGGGFPLGGSGAANAQSTAWAVQGIVAAGADPSSFRRGGADPLGYLAARQAPDGHYAYSASSDQTPVWVTGQALAAVAEKAFPVPAPPRAKPASPVKAKNAPAPAPATKAGIAPPIPSLPGKSRTGEPEPSAASPSHAAGGAAAPAGPHAAPGRLPPAAKANPSADGKRGKATPATVPPAPLAAEPSADALESHGSDSGQAAAAAGLGIAAGALLFAAAWLLRRRFAR
jgi:Squalene-hopene cyclase C-terminal domain/Prenyltransferase and squalene oxidase repeat